MSDTADKHIRVSLEYYERLAQRRRAGESFDDVIGRLLADERDLLAGFGIWEGTDQREIVEEIHAAGKQESRKRIDELSKRQSTDREARD
ncbi:antitoxin VapB family protein [Haladaptatus salinisoli]|uniref:antitoxin VapB family protein n=1 Tax=Haladaptatus salinisoli TaxID=2884876 RepID=UPI001D09C8F7|nr:antitoxin VapB family protein [Haladaptatus salinisoli]